MLIDTAELTRRFGALKVTHKHQIALNRLVLFVHGGMIQAETLLDAAGHNSCKSLPAPLWSVDPALLEADAARHNQRNMSGLQATWQPKCNSTATQLIEEAIKVAYTRTVNPLHLDLTRRLRRKSIAKRKQVALEYQPREILDPTTTNAWQLGRRQGTTEHMHGQPNQSEIRESAPRKRSF